MDGDRDAGGPMAERAAQRAGRSTICYQSRSGDVSDKKPHPCKKAGVTRDLSTGTEARKVRFVCTRKRSCAPVLVVVPYTTGTHDGHEHYACIVHCAGHSSVVDANSKSVGNVDKKMGNNGTRVRFVYEHPTVSPM